MSTKVSGSFEASLDTNSLPITGMSGVWFVVNAGTTGVVMVTITGGPTDAIVLDPGQSWSGRFGGKWTGVSLVAVSTATARWGPQTDGQRLPTASAFDPA